VPLAEQDPLLWMQRMIDEAEALLHRSGTAALSVAITGRRPLQSAHVALRTGKANWAEVVALYDALFAISARRVAINRSLAMAELRGAQAGLESCRIHRAMQRLTEYQPYWAARASGCRGRIAERAGTLRACIGLERDGAVRRFLQGVSRFETERESSRGRANMEARMAELSCDCRRRLHGVHRSSLYYSPLYVWSAVIG